MKNRFWPGVALGALLALVFVSAGHNLTPGAFAAKTPGASPGAGRGGLVACFGVGGVLTRDGDLWQYRPDREKWVPLDESFALEGQTTKLTPLPVTADQVKLMETFGFLVTYSDECWLYDLDRHEWKNVGAPPFHDLVR